MSGSVADERTGMMWDSKANVNVLTGVQSVIFG